MCSKKAVIVAIFLFLPFLSYADSANDESADESIAEFNQKWAVNLSGMYSNFSFRERSGNFVAESPVAISIGVNYKGFSFSICLPILFNYNEHLFDRFNIQLSSYNENLFYEAFFKQYRGFKTEATIDDSIRREINLGVLFTGVSAGWLLNGKNHSLSAAYELDRKQLHTSDSFLFGFGVYYLRINSNEKDIERYNTDRFYIFFGPDAGYSYTFVFPNEMFLNINFVGSLNAGVETNTGEWLFIPQIKPKAAFGYHFNTWSLSVTGSNIITFIYWNITTIDILMPTTIALNVSKRF